MQCTCAVLYCHLWPAWLYILFTHCLINDTISEKKNVFEHKVCVLMVYINFVWSISHSKKKWETHDKKCFLVFMQSARYSCQVLMKLKFSRKSFEKHSNIKFHENPSIGSRVLPCGRKDIHDEAKSRFSQFCKQLAWKPCCYYLSTLKVFIRLNAYVHYRRD